MPNTTSSDASPAVKTPPPLAGGRYVLQRTLGSGGMATVYLATDTLLQVDRAVKLLAPRFASHGRVRQRFLDEARTMARLKHPNVVTVFDVGMEGERPFIVMENIEGGSLMEYIQLHGPADITVAIEIMQGVLSGLGLAHDHGIIHRDIKPHNVLLAEQGVPKVTDFGIARVEDREDSLTKTGAMMGTLAYMAPEQRQNARGVGAGADIYAAGATLYVMLTGRDPFDLYSSELHDELFLGVSKPIADVIKQACRYRPEHRHKSAQELHRALGAVLESMAEIPDEELPVWGPLFRAAPTHDGHTVAAIEAREGATAVPDLSSQTFDIGAMEGEIADLAALRRAHSSPGTLEGLDAIPPSRRPADLRPRPTDQTGIGPMEGAGTGTLIMPDPDEPSEGVAAVEPEPVSESVAPLPPPRSKGPLLAAVAALLSAGIGGLWWWNAQQGEPVQAEPVAPVVELAPPEPQPVAVSEPELSAEEEPAAVAEPEPEPEPELAEPVPEEEPVVAAPPQPREVPRARPVERPPTTAPAPAAAPATEEPEPVATTGHGYINARPFCRLMLDGVDRGVTGWNGELEPGAHRFTLTTEDGRVHEDSIEIVAGEPTRYCWDFGTGAECR